MFRKQTLLFSKLAASEISLATRGMCSSQRSADWSCEAARNCSEICPLFLLIKRSWVKKIGVTIHQKPKGDIIRSSLWHFAWKGLMEQFSFKYFAPIAFFLLFVCTFVISLSIIKSRTHEIIFQCLNTEFFIVLFPQHLAVFPHVLVRFSSCSHGWLLLLQVSLSPRWNSQITTCPGLKPKHLAFYSWENELDSSGIISGFCFQFILCNITSFRGHTTLSASQSRKSTDSLQGNTSATCLL